MSKERVLYCLEQNKGALVPGGKLAKELGISRNSVWKAINSLREQGHDIDSIPNKGYVLNKSSDGLSKEVISSLLQTEYIGHDLRILDCVDSTNEFLKSIPPDETTHGMVALANEQTAGKGRFGRGFVSPASNGVYLSILLKPQLSFDTIRLLTHGAALCVARSICSLYDIHPKIKWVNDILLDGKKLCGILTEVSLSAEYQTVESVVVGIGINTGSVPSEVETIATSLFEETGCTGFRNQLIAEILNEFEQKVQLIEGNDYRRILDEYQSYLGIIGKKVRISNDDTTTLIIEGVDDQGALVGKDQKGLEHHIATDEVVLLHEQS